MKLRFSILCIIHANNSFNRRPLPSIRREDDRSKYCARIRNVQRAWRQLQMANDSPYIAYTAGLRSILWFLSQNNAKPQSRLFFRFLSPSPFLLHFESIGNSFTAKIVLFSSAFPFPAGPPLFYVNTTRRTRRIDKLSGFDDHVRFIVALPPERIFVVEHALMRARELVINAFIEKRDSIRHHFRLLE